MSTEIAVAAESWRDCPTAAQAYQRDRSARISRLAHLLEMCFHRAHRRHGSSEGSSAPGKELRHEMGRSTGKPEY